MTTELRGGANISGEGSIFVKRCRRDSWNVVHTNWQGGVWACIYSLGRAPLEGGWKRKGK